jgi:hypothetical protein
MSAVSYNRVTVQHAEDSFSVFCTDDSLEYRRDEVIMWVDSLARRLGWLDYKMVIKDATEAEANERHYALFENRHPSSS